MSFDPIVFDAISQGNAGRREPQIGDIFLTPKPDPLRDVRLDGSTYLRSEWPLIEDKFAPPMPVLTGLTPVGNMASVGNVSSNERNYGRLFYCKKSNVLHVIHGYYTTAEPRRSMDGGLTWALAGMSGMNDIPAAHNSLIDGLYNEDTFIVARQSSSGAGFSLDRSTDHGSTWSNVLTGTYAQNDSQQQGNMYDGRNQRGSLSYIDGAWYFITQPVNTANAFRLYKSVDDGLNWTLTTFSMNVPAYLHLQMFKSKGRLVFTGRTRNAVYNLYVHTTNLDLTGFTYRSSMNVGITDSYFRHKILQIGEDLTFATGTNVGGQELYAYSLLTSNWTWRSSSVSNNMSSYSVRMVPLGPFDAMSFTSGNESGTTNSFVQYYRDTLIHSTPNLDNGYADIRGGNNSALTGLPQSASIGVASADAIGDGNGLVILKLDNIIYKAQATYLDTFQTGVINPGSAVGVQEPSSSNSNGFTGVMRGRV